MTSIACSETSISPGDRGPPTGLTQSKSTNSRIVGVLAVGRSVSLGRRRLAWEARLSMSAIEFKYCDEGPHGSKNRAYTTCRHFISSHFTSFAGARNWFLPPSPVRHGSALGTRAFTNGDELLCPSWINRPTVYRPSGVKRKIGRAASICNYCPAFLHMPCTRTSRRVARPSGCNANIKVVCYTEYHQHTFRTPAPPHQSTQSEATHTCASDDDVNAMDSKFLYP
ncbi:hypothetical protein LZ30DRAFT_14773 [Colletotrichum cereale]|nr:hypothetical protein LZ30DRAFT_14773 [Colletotrichum cereale]